MTHRLIDLSVPLRAGIASDPPYMLPEIDYADHHQTAPGIAAYFGVNVDQLPEGQYAAMENCRISSHNGTHVDAPYHYFSRMDEAITPAACPPCASTKCRWNGCISPASSSTSATSRTGRSCSPSRSRPSWPASATNCSRWRSSSPTRAAGSRYGEPDYVDRGCGFGRAATLWLVEQGIRVVGTDAWSWDAPFSHTRQRVQETGDAGLIWEGHRVGRDRAYCQIEKMHNLEALPPDGFLISAFPVKIHRGSAGWTRAVAILPG